MSGRDQRARAGFALYGDLYPVERIPPARDSGTVQVLDWFHLTYGDYEVIVDGVSVYGPRNGEHRMDYPVARLWADVLEVTPWALAQVPAQLADRLENVDTWRAWVDRAYELDDHDEIRAVAVGWWENRDLPAFHLKAAPAVAIWRTGDRMRISWRPNPGDSGLWASPSGDATITAEAFLDEVQAFDGKLMSEMQKRIEDVEHQWSRQDLHIDIRELRREQAARSCMLQEALRDPPRTEHTWGDVLAAIAEIDHLLERT